MDLAIIPECYVDTNLTETLVPPQKGYNHQKGCGTVAKTMQESFANSFCVGIIDKDKKEIDYLKEFDEVCKSASLILHKHKQKHHYIIQINPVIERFILASANTAGVSVTDFGLPEDLERFKKEAKTTTSKNDNRFKLLFKALKKAGEPEILRLAAWISYLKENTYQTDVEVLKGM